jgi:hypothetical protein
MGLDISWDWGPQILWSAHLPCNIDCRIHCESGEVAKTLGPPMLCDTCRWTERPGFVRRSNASERNQSELIPCPDCGGQGIALCCDGICEQPPVDAPAAKGK